MSPDRRARSRASVLAALPGWCAARVLVLAGWLVARVGAEEVGGTTTQLAQGWFAWDGAFYRDLATVGYGEAPDDAVRFFPLFPWIGRALGVVLLGHPGLALVLVANLAALAAGALLHRLVADVTGDERLARRSAWLLALFPGAFVLVLPYAEAILLATAVGAVLAAHHGRWWLAAALAAAGGVARPVGVLVAVALAVLVADARPRSRTRATRVGMAAAVVAPLAGLAVVLAHAAFVDRAWTAPLRVQEPLRGSFVFPPLRVLQAVGDLAGTERLGDGLHAPAAVGLVVLVVLAFVVRCDGRAAATSGSPSQPSRRLPLAWSLYAAAVVAVALAAENLNSLERYGASAFPLVVVLAQVTRRQPLARVADGVLAGGVVALTTLAYLGAYVP